MQSAHLCMCFFYDLSSWIHVDSNFLPSHAELCEWKIIMQRDGFSLSFLQTWFNDLIDYFFLSVGFSASHQEILLDEFCSGKFHHFLNLNFHFIMFSNLINFIMKIIEMSKNRWNHRELLLPHKILMTSKFNNSCILSPRNLFNCYSLNIVINGFASLIISEKSIFIVLIIFLMRGNDFLCELRQHEKAI